MEPLPLSDLPRDDAVRRFEGADHGSSVSFFVTRIPPGSGASPHVHPYDETFLAEDGSATFTVAGKEVEVRGGEILVVPARTAHSFVVTGDRPLHLVSIHPSGRVIQASAVPEAST